jgi:hypothetical protein
MIATVADKRRPGRLMKGYTPFIGLLSAESFVTPQPSANFPLCET